MNYSISKASQAEAPVLSQVAMASKAYWGYNDAFMLAARAELEVSEARLCDPRFVYQRLSVNDAIVGFYALGMAPNLTDLSQYQIEQAHPLFQMLTHQQQQIVELEALFIVSEYMNKGFGHILFQHACDYLRSEKKPLMIIQSDPNALPFYLKQGCQVLGSKESGSIRGRYLPLLGFNLI